MGIVRIFLKNIPEKKHIDSLEVNEDLSDLRKQNIRKPMKAISLDEYFKIEAENSAKWKDYQKNKTIPATVAIFKVKSWRGYFETARNTTLKKYSLIAKKRVHTRGRYDLVDAVEAAQLEQELLKNLEEGKSEGTAFIYKGLNLPRKKKC